MKALFEELLDAMTVKDLVDVLEKLAVSKSVKWLPVGKRENNLATINIGSDPAAGVIERITNAIDAVLEREWVERGEPTDMRSPREAVETWFGIKDGRLVNVTTGDTRKKPFTALSERVQVVLHDSEQPKRPTVDVRDDGVGLLTEEFGASILSLNETRKLKKFFLAGAFGQGGSTALSYSTFTVIVSRKAGKANTGKARR